MSAGSPEVLCVIPARGGSKRLPGKNLGRVGGVTLVGLAVLSARDFLAQPGAPRGRVVVDTDSEEIAAEAREWGADVPFLRPARLAADDTSTEESLLHLFERLGWTGPVILLQTTSPLRTGEDIAACWQAHARSGGKPAATVVAAAHAGGAFTIGGDGVLARVESREQSADRFALNGAVYVFPASTLRERGRVVVPGDTLGVEMPADRSLDVDEASDLHQVAGIVRSRPVTEVPVDKHIVGSGRVFVIAEAGVNHNGDAALAHQLVDIAADSGADAVKFQTFEPELLASNSAPKAEYQVTNTGEASSQLDMLRALTLPHAVVRELAAHARDRGITFLSTPFDARSADFLAELGMPAFKVPSGEVTNHPFLEHLARFGKPLLISTGMSTMPEVAGALAVARAAGAKQVALFHALTEYPAPFGECNLRAIVSMRETFGVPVGWSDHTQGISAPIAAVALGADMVEKHFTTSRELPGPDHLAALEPDELTEMVSAIRAVEAGLGDGVKRPAPSEMSNIPIVRRSLHAARELEAGHTLERDDLVALRPASGLPPSALSSVVGRRLRTAVAAGAVLSEQHLA